MKISEAQRNLWKMLEEANLEPERLVEPSAPQTSTEKKAVKQTKAKPFWPELPRGRADIDHVIELLKDWVCYASTSPDIEEQTQSFKNSVLHVLECAIVLELSSYAAKRGFDSEIFIDSVEFAHYLNPHSFQHGYWLELANTLDTCFALEEPYGLSKEWQDKYLQTLISQLKDLALYHAEISQFWKSGRKKGAVSKHKDYVRSKVINSLGERRKVLWDKLVDILKKENDSCPLYFDQATEKVFITSNDNEYTLNLFEKHCSEFAKKTKSKK
jgi:hypothetical protein